jgi:hypothetical protein
MDRIQIKTFPVKEEHTMTPERKSMSELTMLNKAFLDETDTLKRLELKMLLVREKTLEIRDAWNNYNDNSQQQAMDELEKFFQDDKKGLSFHTDISKKSYKGDWSS